MATGGEVKILVKKADGSSERITLAEFRLRQNPSVSAPAPAKAEAPKPVKTFDFSNSAPSIMEENYGSTGGSAGSTSATRADQVDEVVAKLSFRISAPSLSRARSIIQLRLKDVRPERETKELIMQAVEKGGLGLAEKEANQILVLCAEIMGKSKVDISTVQPIKQTPVATVVLSQPVVNGNGAQKTLAEVKNVSAPSAVGSPVKNQINHFFNNQSQHLSMNSTVSKPLSRDVIPMDEEIGPLQEIRYFTLTDFRRLASDPQEAAGRLKQKFINLKEDSIVLLFEALKSWRKSPLYIEYMNIVIDALVSRQKISAVANDKNRPALAEIKALINMEQSLNS